ncbi:MAG TPA: helix-turn-helix domain-containing protein [Streptosporangiaceae bacterium]|nr:helix-turn-helix domain-containing protein [Streptosporangiaceae bacterium]
MYPPATVDRALRLSDIGVTDREIAQIFGVPVAVIQRWRAGRRRAASGIAGLRATACPRCYPKAIDESAYAYLLGLYLGDGYIVRGRRMCTRSLSPAPTTGRASSRLPGMRCRSSCPCRECAVSGSRDARWSGAIRSTGHACSRNSDRDANTIGRSSWKAGRT